jgi:hypothetical protein
MPLQRVTCSDVDVVAIDEFVGIENLTVGSTKPDIEGHRFEMVMGGLKTFKRDRLILTVSYYQNTDEFFGVPKSSMQEFQSYDLEWHIRNCAPATFCELAVFGVTTHSDRRTREKIVAGFKHLSEPIGRDMSREANCSVSEHGEYVPIGS